MNTALCTRICACWLATQCYLTTSGPSPFLNDFIDVSIDFELISKNQSFTKLN